MIEIDNLTGKKIDGKRLENIAKRVLNDENKTETDLSVTFVGEKGIQKLNKKYRKIDRPTDVLSFTYKNAGEVVICPQIVKENAEIFGETFKKELARVLIHGILHILGYDHEKKDGRMIKKQEDYLFKILNTKH